MTFDQLQSHIHFRGRPILTAAQLPPNFISAERT